MEIVGFLAPWLLIGLGVFFVAFSGGPGRAREAYLTGGQRAFGILIVLLYLGIGIAAAAVRVGARRARGGNSARLSQDKLSDASPTVKRGKQLFAQSCAAC